MAKIRKDSKGRVLRSGETVRKSTGTYQYAYTDYYGKRRYIYANTLMDLRTKEEELLRDRLDGINSIAAREMSLNDMFKKYMDTRHDLAPRTFQSYIYLYNAHVRNEFGKNKLNNIRYSDVLIFYKKLINDKQLSYGTVETIHRIIYPIFEMAVRDCIIRNNPAHKVLGQVKKATGAERGIRNALTIEEQEAFLKFMKGHPVYDHWKPIFSFMLGTGVRVGELCGLTWKDVDLTNGFITIDHALVYFAGKLNKTGKRLYMSTPKTAAGIRKIPIIPGVRKALEEVKQYQYDNGIICRSEVDGYTNFVFLNRFGNVYLQSALDRNLVRIIDSYNDYEIHEAELNKREALLLPHFSCHCLRHTFCARVCENETNLKVIQALMGHVDIKTTMNIYAEVSDRKVKSSLDNLQDSINLL